MTTRQALELAALLVLCLVSLRSFWRGDGFTASKKLGLALAIVVFFSVSLVILR